MELNYDYAIVFFKNSRTLQQFAALILQRTSIKRFIRLNILENKILNTFYAIVYLYISICQNR